MKEAYEARLQNELDKWRTQIDWLSAMANKVDSAEREAYYEKLDAICAQQAAASQKLDELRRAEQDTWEALRDEIENSWTELGESLQSLCSRFKE